MKKMLFNLVGGKDEFDEMFEDYKSEYFTFLDGKYYEINKKTFEKKEVIVKIATLSFDTGLAMYLKQLFSLAVEKAGTLSPQPIEGEIESSIASVDLIVMKMHYERPANTFEFGAELFTAVAMGHKLLDGNKRVAFLFMIFSLFFLGINLSVQPKFQNDFSKHVKKFTEFVQRMQINTTKRDENQRLKVKKEVANWIKNSALIVPYDMWWVK